MSVKNKVRLSLVKSMAKLFEVELTIRLFGKVVLHAKFPPSDDPDEVVTNTLTLLDDEKIISQ